MSTTDLASAALRYASDRRCVPSSTYRLQMHAGFTFRDALGLVPYFDALGITHLYLSPILAARAGSTHGYDVIDPTSLNPEIGTEDDFRALVAACRDRGMGVVLDVVPNHMFLGPANPWWRDVLEHGPSSPFAGFFDIAWQDPLRDDLRGRVALPILGAPYHQVLDSGELQVDLQDGALVVRLYGAALPVDPRTYDHIIKPVLDSLDGNPPEAVAELQSILNAVKHLPPRSETNEGLIQEGRAEMEVIKRRIAALVAAQPVVAGSLRAVLDELRRPDANPQLDALLDAQAYRLCFWRVASDEINYRRFFDVNELSALSAEREDVFRATHGSILRFCAEGLADGLRIDHPDGLYDPKQYLGRLQEHYLLAVARYLAECESPGMSWGEIESTVRDHLRRDQHDEGRSPPLYVIVEKILERTEKLPASWPTAGTTGYEFANAVNGLFVDPSGADSLSRFYEAFSGRDDFYSEVVLQSKTQVLQSAFSSELDMLARQLDRLARSNRRARDFTLNGLREALRAVIASFPVYRSYVNGTVSRTDEGLIRLAVIRARRRSPTLSPDLFDFIRDTLLLRDPPAGVPEYYAGGQRQFAGKFQQVTAPVTAKGVEDTAFYRYYRLASLNEVGGDPGRFGWPPDEVHAFLSDRQANSPHALSAGTTHDAKRGEDVRTRIDVLSEWPEEWASRAHRWAEWNRRHRIALEDGSSVPDPNDEYLLYQTLVGTWPGDPDSFAGRIKQYMSKATHEAKENTSWINPNPEYDEAVQQFVTRILDPNLSATFLADLGEFAHRVAGVGLFNSLAQSLIRCTAPGVPDTYQGTELWDLSLVDPDNRRPVDFPQREAFLRDLSAVKDSDTGTYARSLLGHHADGRAKLFLISRALRFRRSVPDLFRAGHYHPVTVIGSRAEHVFAYIRSTADRSILVVVPRLIVRLMGHANRPPLGNDVWTDTRLELPEGQTDGEWFNHLTGERTTGSGTSLAAGSVFRSFPVALLERQNCAP